MYLLMEKGKQFCLWFFWYREWPKEKTIILAALVVTLLLLRLIMKARYKHKMPSVQAEYSFEPIERQDDWRSK